MRQSGSEIGEYILSLPERVLRSASALAGGLANQVGATALPAALRRTRLYKTLVEAVLRFVIEEVGQVEGVFPTEGKLAEDFLLRQTAGNGIALLSILTFHASPVWVLAALADLSGAGRALITEISQTLQEEGLIATSSTPATVEQVLDALEGAAGQAAETLNAPPLDMKSLRKQWASIQAATRAGSSGSKDPPLPGIEEVNETWSKLKETAAVEHRSILEVSALLGLDALTRLPRGVVWLGSSSWVAARAGSGMVADQLLEHYSAVLGEIRAQGLAKWWQVQFRPYLAAAVRHFSTGKRSSTERFLRRRR